MDEALRSERCRQLAVDCEKRALAAKTPTEAAEWMKVRASWLMMAEEIEAIAGRPKAH